MDAKTHTRNWYTFGLRAMVDCLSPLSWGTKKRRMLRFQNSVALEGGEDHNLYLIPAGWEGLVCSGKLVSFLHHLRPN
jgi:hypothetical protein